MVAAHLARVGLRGFGARYPAALSGGQRQRVALARALVIRPGLLMDEPLSNLDAKLRMQIRESIPDLQREAGITTVFVTHDQEEALALSDRIARDEQGPPGAGRHARRSTRPGHRLCRRLHRRGQPCPSAFLGPARCLAQARSASAGTRAARRWRSRRGRSGWSGAAGGRRCERGGAGLRGPAHRSQPPVPRHEDDLRVRSKAAGDRRRPARRRARGLRRGDAVASFDMRT